MMRWRAITSAARRTLATVISSAMMPRQPEVPNCITEAASGVEGLLGASLTGIGGGLYNPFDVRALRPDRPVHRLHRQRSDVDCPGTRRARAGRLRQPGADDPLGLPLEGED